MKRISLIFPLIFLLVGCFQEVEFERPKNVPHKSFFLGGIDGGVWIDTIQKDLTITCYVYSEYGEKLDTCFISAKNEQELIDKVDQLSSYDYENCFLYYENKSF